MELLIAVILWAFTIMIVFTLAQIIIGIVLWVIGFIYIGIVFVISGAYQLIKRVINKRED